MTIITFSKVFINYKGVTDAKSLVCYPLYVVWIMFIMLIPGGWWMLNMNVIDINLCDAFALVQILMLMLINTLMFICK